MLREYLAAPLSRLVFEKCYMKQFAVRLQAISVSAYFCKNPNYIEYLVLAAQSIYGRESQIYRLVNIV